MFHIFDYVTILTGACILKVIKTNRLIYFQKCNYLLLIIFFNFWQNLPKILLKLCLYFFINSFQLILLGNLWTNCLRILKHLIFSVQKQFKLENIKMNNFMLIYFEKWSEILEAANWIYYCLVLAIEYK